MDIQSYFIVDAEPLFVGCEANKPNDAAVNFRMIIDDLKGWDLVLTPSEVTLLYTSTL